MNGAPARPQRRSNRDRRDRRRAVSPDRRKRATTVLPPRLVKLTKKRPLAACRARTRARAGPVRRRIDTTADEVEKVGAWSPALATTRIRPPCSTTNCTAGSVGSWTKAIGSLKPQAWTRVRNCAAAGAGQPAAGGRQQWSPRGLPALIIYGMAGRIVTTAGPHNSAERSLVAAPGPRERVRQQRALDTFASWHRHQRVDHRPRADRVGPARRQPGGTRDVPLRDLR